jgi:hypothetical protein
VSPLDWAKFPRELLELPPLAQRVFVHLDLKAGTKGHCNPTQAEIAERAHGSRQRVNEALRLLVSVDLISVKQEGKSRRYFVHQRGVQAPARGPQLLPHNGASREGHMLPEVTRPIVKRVTSGHTSPQRTYIRSLRREREEEEEDPERAHTRASRTGADAEADPDRHWPGSFTGTLNFQRPDPEPVYEPYEVWRERVRRLGL